MSTIANLRVPGARQLIDSLYIPPNTPGAPALPLSPPNTVKHIRKEAIGLPLPAATEQINLATGKRLVYFAEGIEPVAIVAEQRKRFISIAFRCDAHATGDYVTLYGTVLGYSGDNREIIWHERSEKYATRVPIDSIYMIHREPIVLCKHCGLVVRDEERAPHSIFHKKGSGTSFGIFMDDPLWGTLSGDSGLAQALQSSPQPMGGGAQGVIHLYEVYQPTAAEVQQHPDWYGYRYVSKYLSTPSSPITQVVVKTIQCDTKEKVSNAYQKAVRLMTALNHPHLVEYLALQITPGTTELRIIMPHYQEGDLRRFMQACQGSPPEHIVCSIALQLSDAVAFLHERNPPLVHGDIKPDNVMLYNNMEQVVLMDLDASHELHQGNSIRVRNTLGTFEYMAPERQYSDTILPASDIWSLGVLFYVLTVLPEFPMIEHPEKLEATTFHNPIWASAEDRSAIFSALQSFHCTPANLRRASVVETSKCAGITLSDCIHANISRKGYSVKLAQLIADMLFYNPLRRPSATQVRERLTEILENHFLNSSEG